MTPPNFDATTEAFLGWFKTLPGATFSDSIKIVDLRSRNAGRGIVATEDIAQDSTLFTIPRTSIISTETSKLPEKLPGVFDLDAVPVDDNDDAPQKDSWSSLILIMMYEFLRGEDSSWKPYFDILPETFETPMFWSDGELDELQASSVRQRVGRADAEDMFRANVLPVIRQNPELFASSADMSDEHVIALAHRMGSTIMAYAFHLENDDDRAEDDESDGWVEDRDGRSVMGMVPMADVLNADAEFNAYVNHGEHSLTVTALKPIKAGEEVLNYYGDLPNSELLRRYGYVTEKHLRYDTVEMPWDIVEDVVRAELGIPDDKLVEARKHLEDEIEDAFILERSPSELDPPGTFAGPAKFLEMPAELKEQLNELLKAIRKVDPESIPDKRKRDAIRTRVFSQSLQTLLARYPTTATEDQRILDQGGLPERKRMAIQVRMGEKKLLHEAQLLLQQQATLGADHSASEPNKRAKVSA